MNPKVLDFGLARIFIDDDEEVKTNRITGRSKFLSAMSISPFSLSMNLQLILLEQWLYLARVCS